MATHKFPNRRYFVATLNAALIGCYVKTTQADDQATGVRSAGATEVGGPADLAMAFLDTLTSELRAKAVVPYESESRVDWHFFPKDTRKGVPLREMTEEQEAAARRLMASCLSPEGNKIATQIMELETLIGRLEGDKSWTDRDPKKFYFTIFGQPTANPQGAQSRWGLSVEGHHLSLNFVFQGNAIVDSTPQLFAANPARVQADYDGFPKGLEVLRAEEQNAFELVQSLSETQLKKALLAGDTLKELRNAGIPQPVPGEDGAGISVGEFTEKQQGLLAKILLAYTSKMPASVSEQRWELIEKADFNKIVFAWSGGTTPGQNHYYTLQGPTFLIEFINVQKDSAGNPANHIHSVWRDRTGDFDLPAA